MQADRCMSRRGGQDNGVSGTCFHTQTLSFLVFFTNTLYTKCPLTFQVTKDLWDHQDPKVYCTCSDITSLPDSQEPNVTGTPASKNVDDCGS